VPNPTLVAKPVNRPRCNRRLTLPEAVCAGFCRSNLSEWRNFVCFPLLVILPVSLTAQENATAILKSNGGVLLNDSPAPASSALFSNSHIQTQKGAEARIEASGSAAYIAQDTIVQFADGQLNLDHGTLSIDTSRGLKVRIGCVTVMPAHELAWTRYDVTDVDSNVTVSVLKNDVSVELRPSNFQQTKGSTQSSVTLHEGEKKTFDEKCGVKQPKEGATLPGIGAIMDSPWVIGAGAGAIITLTCWALCRSGAPLSPKDP
jgi:hypothetical protein